MRIRRIALVVVLVLVTSGIVWIIWPTTKWPLAFCHPVIRVVGTDAAAVLAIETHSEWHRSVASTPGASTVVDKMRSDIGDAIMTAPTSQLRLELNSYLIHASNFDSMLTVDSALNLFDHEARTQLEDCGVSPIGSGS
jgi:hypothetical protein